MSSEPAPTAFTPVPASTASTTERGRTAEGLAAAYLAAHGYDILARNWRNRWCELDIVARLGDDIHIIEVKYRRNVAFGYAAEYISHDKTARLMRAALAWTQAAGYDGPYQIGVATVEGDLESPAIAYLPEAISG